ncbi:cytochrome P450 4C1-like [Vanessa cardui]|uniref:cytochrome P450 4C1-like n=1 Tax=Vanessa cardui TaxID=171605 RepID=UPI001F14164D|nr:cytochrome P450 4C1-like [Vanessa cardui]
MFVQYLIVIVILLLIVDRWKPKKMMILHQQLGNDWAYYPIIGNAFSFIGNNEDLMTTFMKSSIQGFRRRYNAISFWLGNIFFVGINDADQAIIVLKSTLDKNFVHKFTKYLTGNGLVFAPVDIWHRRRKILAPSFASRYVSKFVTVFEAHAKIIAEELECKVGKGDFSCLEYVNRYALDSICETEFGMNMDMQRQPKHPFFNAFVENIQNIAARLCLPWLHIDAIYKLLPVYSRQEATKKIIYEFIDNLIYKKTELIKERDGIEDETDDLTDKSNIHMKSFLELMIENSKNTDKAYSHEELREETLILALAGTDTSAIGICFTILLLSQHSDIQERVYNEIQEILGDSDKPLQMEDLLKLKYTKAVINETLRLYPPVPFITRCCTEDLILPNGILVPKDSNVVVSIWGIHHNPLHWGDDVEDFNPDRFMSGQIPTAFMPFSHGPRNCVGYKYAMLSLTTTLVTLLRKYRFTPATNFKYDKNNPLRLSFAIMMKHVHGFTVQMEYRK